MKIYLDHSATTPMDKQVLKVMLPYFSDKFGNPSSIHGFGQAALAGVDAAREELSRFLNCAPDEIIFTSGATESDNLAIKGVVKALKKQGIKREEMHIITSLIEHDAVLEPLTDQEAKGMKITRLPVKANGVVDIEKFKKAIRDDTVLVSIMYVNSEVGSIQPIREIGKIIKNINEKRLKEWHKCRTKNRGEKPRPIYFHTDATQAVNFLDCDVKRLHCDLLSLSGHKIYGPKGVGALFVKSETPLKPVQLGGHHERNLRSGTLNVPGIVGLGEAIRLLDKKSREVENKKIVKLRDMLVNGIMKNIPNAILNTDREISTPSHAHFSFLGVEGESILISLDLKGIAVSTGSACASSSLKASHVLLAMGIKPEVAHNSIRFTLGKLTTEAEIKQVIKILPPIIKRLRKMSPEH
ncbi:cysteine desulfurase [Patescibacteria group bacterium]|nr:cysteine desulfurase [Patescibacteria group bacterium]MBU4015425.1 cysteine desulfurase [Patescibacteria group bacterium]MBU4026686.1 cysteine desulfurase [Patescibacteria group bacterium]MBU4072959.1 cysteine desulfurase [Patescibacteria group bacterium]MBU4102587.1 cysteine desulfurase [Patescibacteria group bacterium]